MRSVTKVLPLLNSSTLDHAKKLSKSWIKVCTREDLLLLIFQWRKLDSWH